MFLRSIQIRGFKSFADKTLLEFAPGVSVIVGPNGSGKSNLVDAISWALGEQGPRALRGGHMADVIFAGTPSRPALGMAEVKLVIDNTAGKIAVPMTEIEISRTIFRSGESEYRIGGQVVRLLDVQELLSESGIGRALHTVVGQGQLEEVLLAKPEDRRKYVEEAAGVAKHRRRKERAERKLAGLDQDLLRLSDDGVQRPTDPGLGKELLDVHEPHDLPTDPILGLAGPEDRPGDLDLRHRNRDLALGVVDDELDLGHAEGRARGCAGEDHVGHVAATERAGPLLAERPADRVDEVRLARAVRPHDHRDAGDELQDRLVRERLEPADRDLAQEHAARMLTGM